MPRPSAGIVVLSATRAAAYKPSGHEICISITDPKSDPAVLSAQFAEVLRLSFSDIAAPSPWPRSLQSVQLMVQGEHLE